jgi:hypothetical protein
VQLDRRVVVAERYAPRRVEVVAVVGDGEGGRRLLDAAGRHDRERRRCGERQHQEGAPHHHSVTVSPSGTGVSGVAAGIAQPPPADSTRASMTWRPGAMGPTQTTLPGRASNQPV